MYPCLRPFAIVTVLIVSAIVPHRVLAGAARRAIPAVPSCAAIVPAPSVCDRTLGVALAISRGWSAVPRDKFPPGYLAFWTLRPGDQEPPLHLVIEAVGLAACRDAHAAVAVAHALVQTTNSPRPIAVGPVTSIAGAAAVAIKNLPGSAPSVVFIVAHHGVVYMLTFLGSNTLRSDQRLALNSLHFIPRVGPFPGHSDRFMAAALRACASARTASSGALHPVPINHNTEQATRVVSAANGPLIVLDQRGDISAQVQIGPRQDEILAIESGRVDRVLARRLTTYSFGAGLAASPDGRFVAFAQTDADVQGHLLHSRGLWLAARQGGAAHAPLTPPGPANSGEPFDIGAVAWSPDGHTLAYAVNLYSDTPIAPSLLAGTGLWLARTDGSRRRLVRAFVAPQSAHLTSIASCGSPPTSAAIDALSWMDARTVTASVECINAAKPGRIVSTILAVDTTTGSAHTIVAAGRDAASAPATRWLAYVTGPADGISPTTLWVADAQGRHAHRLITAQTLLSSPAWSPDGRSIAYITAARIGASLHTSIHTVDIVTGHSRTLLADDARGQPLLPSGGHFARLAWLPAPS